MTEEPENRLPGMMRGLSGVARRDLLLAWKRPGDSLNPLFFFAMVCTLFPLSVGPGAEELQLMGPAVVWVAALLSMLLSLNTLFLGDHEDGSLEQLLVSAQPLPLMALGKTLSHWLLTGLPLLLISPLLALAYRLPTDVVLVLVGTLLPGTLCLSLLGSIGAALTVGLNRGTTLLSLLVLPLAMPVLLLGANTVSLAAGNEMYASGIWALSAYAVAALSLAPYATAAALRVSNE